MSKRARFILAGGGLGLGLLCCVAGLLFVIWTNQPENQAAFQATDTAVAARKAQSAATATAAAQALNSRLKGAQPVFAETFNDGSPFLKNNIGDLGLTMRDGVPEITLAFAAYHLWPSGLQLQDFLAELDCSPVGEETFCGLAYGVQTGNAQSFYASYIEPGGSCGFGDHTGAASADKVWSCNSPAASADHALNHLRVVRSGPLLRFYVNDAVMDERTLNNPAALSGDVAIYFGRAASDTGGSATVQMDNFNIWKLPTDTP